VVTTYSNSVVRQLNNVVRHLKIVNMDSDANADLENVALNVTKIMKSDGLIATKITKSDGLIVTKVAKSISMNAAKIIGNHNTTITKSDGLIVTKVAKSISMNAAKIIRNHTTTIKISPVTLLHLGHHLEGTIRRISSPMMISRG
jgi:hypothetical protein